MGERNVAVVSSITLEETRELVFSSGGVTVDDSLSICASDVFSVRINEENGTLLPMESDLPGVEIQEEDDDASGPSASLPLVAGVRLTKTAPTCFYIVSEDLIRDMRQEGRRLALGDRVLVDGENGPAPVAISALRRMGADRLTTEECPSLGVIYALAGPDDIEQCEKNEQLSSEAKAYCRQCIRERDLDMKLVDVEVSHDRGKIAFYFTAPARIDFRELVKDLVRKYRTRIELRQIGVRHETQMLGAVGNCGMVCCCRRYLRNFVSVAIKMAKEQNIFLNPAKISGICGRLLCCLAYEQENYDEFYRRCPKLGKKYMTSRGAMRVLRANMFRESVSVLSENNEELEFTLEEWKTLEPRRHDGSSGYSDTRTDGYGALRDANPHAGKQEGPGRSARGERRRDERPRENAGPDLRTTDYPAAQGEDAAKERRGRDGTRPGRTGTERSAREERDGRREHGSRPEREIQNSRVSREQPAPQNEGHDVEHAHGRRPSGSDPGERPAGRLATRDESGLFFQTRDDQDLGLRDAVAMDIAPQSFADTSGDTEDLPEDDVSIFGLSPHRFRPASAPENESPRHTEGDHASGSSGSEKGEGDGTVSEDSSGNSPERTGRSGHKRQYAKGRRRPRNP